MYMGHTFQLFNTFDTSCVQILILIKLPEVKKNIDKMTKVYYFLHVSSFTPYSTIKL
jgi:hypothetical protein